MKKPKKSEKLLLDEIATAARNLKVIQRNLSPGQVIALYRRQLGMSQRDLAKRAKIPQASLSGIESGHIQPNTKTWEKIANALNADLLITFTPRQKLETFKKERALTVAKKKIEYLRGTMSLEKQEPDNELLKELLEEEVKSLLYASNSKLWKEEI